MERMVVKRDGQIVKFDLSKIEGAVKKAFDSKQEQYNPDVIKTVIDNIPMLSETPMSVEEIQDIVEKSLMEHGHYKVARHLFCIVKNTMNHDSLKKDWIIWKNIVFLQTMQLHHQKQMLMPMLQ